MLDITMLRKQLPEVIARLATRPFEFPQAEFNALENERKSVQTQTEELQAQRNALSKKIGMAKKSGEDASGLMQEAAAIPEKLTRLEEELAGIRDRLNDLLMRIPNLPHASVPVGKDENEKSDIITPHLRAIDAFYPADKGIEKALRGGITTVCTGPGSANIVFGSDETPEEIIEHLEWVRSTQDIAGGFKSFVVWTFQPQTPNFPIRKVSDEEYLKLLALSRLYLDNVPHIEVSLLGMGLTLGAQGLYAGADDINSIVIEENVLTNHGLTTIPQAEEFIKNAGFIPYRRSLNFD